MTTVTQIGFVLDKGCRRPRRARSTNPSISRLQRSTAARIVPHRIGPKQRQMHVPPTASDATCRAIGIALPVTSMAYAPTGIELNELALLTFPFREPGNLAFAQAVGSAGKTREQIRISSICWPADIHRARIRIGVPRRLRLTVTRV